MSELEKLLLAVHSAVTFKPDLMTNDKLEAATKGHGSLVIAVLSTANVIAEFMIEDSKYALIDASAPEIPLDIMIERAVRTAKEAGASPENAALIAASLAYFAGVGARAGVPMANRKLGALARMHAGAARTGGIGLVTNKFTNRIPAFAAYQRVFEKLRAKKLLPFDGAKLPPFVAGGAIYGHSRLGEDIAIPTLAKEIAKEAALGVKEAMEGAGITAYPLWPALIGTTVAMEIVHPDCFLGPEYGPFGSKDSAYTAGLGAIEALGLPKAVHIRGTHEELDFARVLGDFGLILKDIGAPSVLGSMALNEIFAGLEEAPIIGAGFSGGPVNPPLGHLCGDAVPAIRLLMKYKGDMWKAAEDIKKYKLQSFIDPEMAICSLNTIARKAEEVRRGPVTKTLLLASVDVRDRAIYRRALKVYEMLKAGKSLEEVARELDLERKEYVEKRGSMILSAFTGKKIEIKFTELRGGGRRPDKFSQKYWGFDSYISYDVVIDGQRIHVENLSAKAVPEFVLEDKVPEGIPKDLYGLALFAGAVVAQELQYIGHTIINITVPAAVGALALDLDPKTAAKQAAKGAWLTRAIPGAKERAVEVAAIAKMLYKMLNTEKHDILPPVK